MTAEDKFPDYKNLDIIIALKEVMMCDEAKMIFMKRLGDWPHTWLTEDIGLDEGFELHMTKGPAIMVKAWRSF